MTTPNLPIGAAIRSIRKSRGLTMTAAARRVGENPAWMSRLETHGLGTSVRLLCMAAEALEVEPWRVVRHAERMAGRKQPQRATLTTSKQEAVNG